MFGIDVVVLHLENSFVPLSPTSVLFNVLLGTPVDVTLNSTVPRSATCTFPVLRVRWAAVSPQLSALVGPVTTTAYQWPRLPRLLMSTTVPEPHRPGMIVWLRRCAPCRFYAYPTAVRYRVAQILVLPPYQRMGIGRALLDAVNKVLRSSTSFTMRPADAVACLAGCVPGPIDEKV